MLLLGLLFVPVVLGLIGLLIGKGRITMREFLVHEAVVAVVLTSGYFIAKHGSERDTEIWNGVIAKKWEQSGPCCHSYPCNCHSCDCDSKGRCSTCCSTCYEHTHDDDWYARTSNGETVYSNTCNAPGSSAPARWRSIRVGEPTAVEHSYVNYIKANHSTLFRRTGALGRFKGSVPDYPEVYDHYRIRRFLTVGVHVPGVAALNSRLDRINARLGARKQVNMIVLVVAERDPAYIEALRQRWLGGKKNDLITVIGAPDFPKISWVGVVSWTRVETLKIAIRDKVMALDRFDGNRVLDIIERQTNEKFVRTPMADFKYLQATASLPSWMTWLLFGIGLVIAIVLEVWFWEADPFGRPYRRQ